MNRQRGSSFDLSEARIQLLAPNAVRITRYARHLSPDRPWLRHVLFPSDLTGLRRTVGSHDLSGLTAEVREGIVHVQTRGGEVVLTEARPPRQSSNDHIHLALRIAPDEGLYGWGEWFNAFRRGRGTVRLRANESPSFLQGRQTYSTIPFFLSSRGYGFFLLNSYESHWRIRPEQGVLEIDVAGLPADTVVIYGPAWRDILTTYTALTGRPPLVPRWALGLWVTGYPQEDQAHVLALVDEHRRRALPLDTVILDYHWEEGFHNFRWRRSLFPAPDQLVAELKARGVRLGLIFTPFVNNHRTRLKKAALNLIFHNVPHGLEQDDERALPEYDVVRARGYLAHDHASWWFGEGGMLDFTHPEAARW
jgi:alpha-glucosidase (family GH31 glycosyl hydrolase)